MRGTVWGFHGPLVLVSCALFSLASELAIYLGGPVSPNLLQVSHRYEMQVFQQVV